jgi:cytochrome c peroxidase
MSRSKREFRALFLFSCVACSDAMSEPGELESTVRRSFNLTASERLAACAEDPRVVAGLMSAQVCAGADIFFNETFDGNGRTCGSCHPANNNTTLDVPFVQELHASNPDDPLFINENDPNLAQLETRDLVAEAAILENVDEFSDPTRRFVSRGVNHVLSLRTSIAPDTGDGTTNPPVERAGWGGDGSDDGSLRGFLEGAVRQHFTRDLRRRAGTDFRTPTDQEAELTETFQLSLGRLNELNLQQVNLFDEEANEGRRAFLDPQRGRCNVCHLNAGANFIDTGRNRNFDTEVNRAGSPLTLGRFGANDDLLLDGGFGGKELTQPNFDGSGIGFPNAFGNGTFSPPPLIEAADTPPFFHNNFRPDFDVPPTIEQAVAFYARIPFGFSPAARELEARFGAPLNLVASDSFAIARFLRVLNAAFNMDLARQRLEAAQTLVNRFGDTRVDIQRGLMELADAEVEDALEVLATSASGEILPAARQHLQNARNEIAAGLTAPSPSTRQNRISNALARVMNGRDLIGSNINFQLGQGNLAF